MDHIEMRPEDYRVEGMETASDAERIYDRAPRVVRDTFLDRIDVIKVFIGICIALFALEFLLGGAENVGVLIALGANYGSFVDRGEFWRLVTANFLHGGLMHIFVNGYSLYILGRFAESVYGRTRLALVFLITAVFAAFVSWQANGALSVGASGGIAGFLGLLFAFTLRYREKLDPRFRSNFMRNLVFIVGLNIFIALMDPRIDNWAHLGGFAAGFLSGWAFIPKAIFAGRGDAEFLRAGAYFAVFILIAAFAAQAFSFVFSTIIPEKGFFRTAITADGSVQLAYPAFFEISPGSREDREEMQITNHSNRTLFFSLMQEQYVYDLVQEFSRLDAQYEEGMQNGQKVMRVNGAIPTEKGQYGVAYFFMQAPSGSPQAGTWAALRISRPGRITSGELRLLDVCARQIFFIGNEAI
ncbi:MAG: rhomboid family intramembrane serine protease [Spirochaetota bacterium]|jgi:membrane associated rhomboid family serine protease|nr:rhomboid family intramembrane serine protease [Spirochaetota bacterium]